MSVNTENAKGFVAMKGKRGSMIHFSDDLYKLIKKTALENDRSISSQVRHIVRQHFAHQIAKKNT